VWADFGPAVEPSSLGCNVIFSEKASPVPQPTIKDLEDIDRLQVPDPWKDGLMPLALKARHYMVKKIPSNLKKQYGYGQWTFALGPTDIAGLSMGYDKFLIGLFKYPESIRKLMKVAMETTLIWIEAQQDVIGSDLLTYISGDTDNFLNPVQFKTFSFPYISSVCKKLRKKGNVVLYHNDGNTTHLLDDLREVGANMFNYEQGMKTSVVMEKAGKNMGLVGGLNSIGEMLNGKAGDVREEARKAILEGAVGGGFVLSNEGGMASHTPWENIVAMIESARRFDRYT
jgi:uroporphyrinogen decarboxylase